MTDLISTTWNESPDIIGDLEAMKAKMMDQSHPAQRQTIVVSPKDFDYGVKSGIIVVDANGNATINETRMQEVFDSMSKAQQMRVIARVIMMNS